MNYAQNSLDKNMVTSNRSYSTMKYSLKNKINKVQYPILQNQNQTKKYILKGNYTANNVDQPSKDKFNNTTDNFGSTLQDQSTFNCYQNSKTVLKFNQTGPCSESYKQSSNHLKNSSQFSAFSSKLNINSIKYDTKPISQNNFSALSSKNIHNTFFRVNHYINKQPNARDMYLQTENSEKYSLKKKDNFQLKIKPNYYPCFKYSDLSTITKKITKEELRSIEDFKNMIYKQKKQSQFSRMMCKNIQQSRQDDGCQCYPKCIWVNRWMNMTYRQQYHNNSLASSRNQANYKQIVQQIQKDIPRTQTNTKYLLKKQNKQKLRQVLQTYSKIDPNVGYVQGMNIIASVVIYHSVCLATANELFNHLMKNAGLRKIYLNDLSFSQELNKQMMKQLKSISYDLYNHLTNQQIDLCAFTSSWYFSLMGTFVPLQYMHFVFDKFFRKGWTGINEIIITFLLYFKSKFMAKQNEELFQCFSIRELQQQTKKMDWQEIIVRSQNLLLKTVAA